jgi:hypothetical protein
VAVCGPSEIHPNITDDSVGSFNAGKSMFCV